MPLDQQGMPAFLLCASLDNLRRGMSAALVIILCCIAASGLFGIIIGIQEQNGKQKRRQEVIDFEQEYRELRRRNEEFSARLYPVASRNNQGIEFEKSGNIEDAIKCYEQNIVEGQYPTRHPYDRLMVLYRRLGNYDDEIRVIRSAITTYQNDGRYIDKLNIRLQKAQTLKDKMQ